jgi:hypothetical protein
MLERMVLRLASPEARGTGRTERLLDRLAREALVIVIDPPTLRDRLIEHGPGQSRNVSGDFGSHLRL